MSSNPALKPFLVVLSLKPAVRLPQNMGMLELNFEDRDGPKKVQITKIEESIKETLIQVGLRFRVFLNAGDLHDAIESAKSLTDGVVSFLTMMTGRGLQVPREEIAYELTPEAHERDFVQIFYDAPIPSVSRRQIDPQRLIKFIDSQMKLEGSFSERLARAGRWYRLGATVTDIFDQFNCFWIGLESLNPLLQQKLSVEDDKTVCRMCGHIWVSTPTVSGIRVFLQEKMNDGETLYRNIHKLRIAIMHSTQKLQDIRELVSVYTPKTGEALFRAICYLSGFEEWETITQTPILKEFPVRVEVQCVLVGGDPQSLGPTGQDPHFELSYQIRDVKIGENGQINYNVDHSYTAVLNPNVQWRPRSTRFYGDSETTAAIQKSSVRTASGEETITQKK